MLISDWSSDVCSSDLTEASPVVSCNPPGAIRIHTAGPALRGVEIRIAEDGEILVRGDLLMKGYWHDPETTAQTIVDGWLHTGDVGVVHPDGYIEITDRKKDIIVNSGGDNISPARLEGKLTLEPEILQDRKSTRLNSRHQCAPRMPSAA